MRIKWTFEKLQIEALKYKTRADFYRKNQSAYSTSWREGILDKICSHMTNGRIHWTLNKLKKEALKYKTRYEFHKKSPAAYSSACKRKLLNSICSHMEDVLNYWTLESIEQEALKYQSRWDFSRKSPGSYGAALRMGILDRICSHIKTEGSSSKPELLLFQTIKDICPTAYKLIDRKVKIIDKPYIKGFDIDIFIPELNKGIEFDGTYYHSFECMRNQKGKSLWSNEDIGSYHYLKDAWFASKEIKILHVKQEDWIKNKEECVLTCLSFLFSKQEKAA